MGTLLSIPETAAPGEIVEIRILIQHPMETGFRPGADGRLVPRFIVREVLALFEGAEVFRAELHPAVAANPFLSFHLRAEASGEVVILWTEDDGTVHREAGRIAVG